MNSPGNLISFVLIGYIIFMSVILWFNYKTYKKNKDVD